MYKYVERVVNNLKSYTVEQLSDICTDSSTCPVVKQVASDMLEAKLIALIGKQYYKEALLNTIL